ncbi:response regulator [Paenibacillus rigui]|uniref:Circadian input-output histidine kinase CikA n=1 Tax=Paenibacillus rigui TaxID=554312 RepID=A0A229UPH8_9BACL|nr:response regulator [Paenibacillus rigui]OXM85283.1 histidine kinase [Paenibacillus rigui]
MFKPWRFDIRSKIGLGYLLIVLCLGVSVFTLNSRIASMQKEINYITEHDMAVHYLTYQVEKHLLDMETGMRGYVITGDSEYLEPYHNAQQNWESDYNKLYELVKGNPLQAKNLEMNKASIEQWIRTAGEAVLNMKGNGNSAGLNSFFKSDTGKRQMDQLRMQFDTFRNTEKAFTASRVAGLNQSNATLKVQLYVLMFLITVVSLVVAYIISRSIIRTVKQVGRAITEIAASNGVTTSRIVVYSNDEIKDLAEAANQLLESQEKQAWLQNHLAEVAIFNQGFTDISELGEAFLAKMAMLMHASYGAFYLAEGQGKGQVLRRIASYASDGNDKGAPAIRRGEGLVGQSALDQRMVVLNPAPADYIKITSALGDSAPHSLLICPIVFEGRTEAVIELASLQPFTDIELLLMKQIRASFGISLNRVLGRMEVERLLIETQTQAMELQAQTEELQQQAEELQAQSEELVAQQDELKASNDLLRKSEDRLQRQQEELEQSNEELSQRSILLEEQMRQVEEVNRQIEEQRDALQQQAAELSTMSKYKSEFLANMSHELRTPLNSLLILSQLLTENKQGNLDEKQVEFARTIHSSGNDLLRLIDEILDLSKVEAGQMKIELEPVVLTDVKDNLFRSFQEMAVKKGLRFEFDMAPDLPDSIVTDGHRLQQILKNLLSNAFKFTTGGEVKVRIFLANKGSAAHSGQQPFIGFAVHDTGIGIPKDKMEMIFEAFQQADGTTSRKYGGTGLGLTISRELSHLIGGCIELESQEGRGSTFTLYVPETGEPAYQAARKEAASTVEPIETPAGAPADPVLVPSVQLSDPALLESDEVKDDRERLNEEDRVLLIIEDDAHFAGLMLDMARSRGFKGLVALRGDVGLALAHAYKPDAVLLDIQLPVLDGWSILERLKQHPETRHIPVHVISVVEEPQQMLTMGAMAYLKKPASREKIENAFARIESFMNRGLKRLLIVEDDIVLRDSLVELIGHDDVAITAVSTGEEALRALHEEHFDCMVMDLGLSDMSGFDLLDRIRQNHTLLRLPIIIYTGKELDRKEEIELKKYAKSIIIKNVRSQERLYDETALFLHRVEANLPEERRNLLKKLHSNEAAFEGKRILLVEDDIRNVFALSNVLESYNLQVSFAENGREALDLLDKQQDFDLILMDIMMPEMDGYQAMEAIRAMPRYAKLPIIALTAKAMKEDRQKCIDAGASDYISKPIDPERLLSLLKVWLYK